VASVHWAANAVSNLGDGIALAAGPLLVASLTDDPALIAGAAFAQQLPWLLFSLVSDDAERQQVARERTDVPA